MMASSNEIAEAFNAHFPVIVKELSTINGDENEIAWSFKRIQEIVEYNVPHGKRTRGLTVASAYNALKKNKMTEKEQNASLSLGWAVEILQASFLVADDLMDQSETRRGQTCWYRKPGVGFQAVNDSMVLESCVYSVIRNSCSHLPCYVHLLDLFHKVVFNTEMGQSLDMMTSELPTVDFSLFTSQRYLDIIKYKTGYYSFYLPVAAAMYLAGISDKAKHSMACDLLLRIGILFQIQDDFLDCYGDPKLTGKIGTDIEDTKCTWLIVKAIELANPDQLKELEENYGKKDLEKIAAVKQVFNDLNLKTIFEKFEAEQYESICTGINNFEDETIPKSIFLNLINKIYKRRK